MRMVTIDYTILQHCFHRAAIACLLLTVESRPATPRLKALTLEQLSAGLDGPTPASLDRNYTQFDMADAMAVTSSLPMPPAYSNHQMIGDRRQDNGRPAFTTYSTDNSVMETSESSLWLTEQEFNTQRPEDYDQEALPSRSYDNPLMVDTPKQMTQEDLMFLYNITFLTDTDSEEERSEQKPLASFPAVSPYPITGPDYLQYEDQYEPDPADYPTFPLEKPTSRPRVEPEEFNEAIEEFLAEYDTYSKAVSERASKEAEKSLDSLLGGLDLGTGLLESKEYDYMELLEDSLERKDEEDLRRWGGGGHHVNHRTHSVPEYANQLIRGRLGEETDLIDTMPTPLPMPGFRFTRPTTTSSTTSTTTASTVTTTARPQIRLKNHPNHQPVFAAQPGTLVQGARTTPHDGVKEVLMVLNATGKINSKEVRDGYYPESEETKEEEEEEEDWVIELSDDSSVTGVGEGGEALTMAVDVPLSSSIGADDKSNEAAGDVAAGDAVAPIDPVGGIQHEEANDFQPETTETTTEHIEFSSFYPMSSQEMPATTTESMVEVYDNLSNLVDTWDEDTDLYEDQVAKDLAELNKEIAALEAQEALEKKLYKEREDFPLKNYISEPSPNMRHDANLAKAEGHQGLNPEKLAYILIGVCCGLSILCLIVVAVSIGYKSETHYRLEEPQRKRIRLLKASHGSDSDSSSASSQEGTGDRSRAKLGNWFTGKHTIQVSFCIISHFSLTNPHCRRWTGRAIWCSPPRCTWTTWPALPPTPPSAGLTPAPPTAPHPPAATGTCSRGGSRRRRGTESSPP